MGAWGVGLRAGPAVSGGVGGGASGRACSRGIASQADCKTVLAEACFALFALLCYVWLSWAHCSTAFRDSVVSSSHTSRVAWLSSTDPLLWWSSPFSPHLEKTEQGPVAVMAI